MMVDQSRTQPVAPDHDQPPERAALLIIDMINDFAFPGAEALIV